MLFAVFAHAAVINTHCTYFLGFGEVEVVHDVHELLERLGQAWIELLLLVHGGDGLTFSVHK